MRQNAEIREKCKIYATNLLGLVSILNVSFVSLFMSTFSGYLNETAEVITQNQFCLEFSLDNNLVSDNKIDENFVSFIHNVLQRYLLNMATTLSEVSYNIVNW